MGLTFRLGQVPLAIFTDTSNNVGIGGAANASFKLQVTGATNVTGVLTLGSTISNGTYTYTLPSATGTLALTSNLSAYLPLTGGTLTGALSGTSATFTSGLINGTTDAFFDINRSASGNAGRVRFQTAGTDEFEIGLKGGVAGFHITKGDATELFTIASTGAATFSSFVGINGSPATGFPLEAYINSSTAYSSTSRGNVMRVYNSNTSANVYAGIELGGAGPSNDGLAGINGVVTAAGSGALTFYTRDSNTFAEKLRITSGGNVGIGTSSPTTKFFLLGNGSYNTPTSEILTSDATIWSSEMTNNAYNSILQLVSVRQSLSTGAFSNGFLGFSTIDDSNGEGIRDAGRIAIVNESGDSRNSPTALSFWTNPGGTKTTAATERLRITSAGNVLVGYNQTTTTTIGRTFATSHAAGNRGATLFYGLTDGGNGGMLVYNVASSVGGHNSQYITFETHEGGVSSGERMRITSVGDVSIGHSGASGQRLRVQGASSTASDFAFVVANASTTSMFFVRNDGYMYFGLEPNSPYNIAQSGRTCILASNGTVGYLSSTRESKTNIENLSDISWLYQLNPVSFNYRKKDDENNYTNEAEDDKWYGLIADEVESINEDLVFYKTKEDKTKELAGVEYNKLIAALVKSVQELKAEIEELKALINK